MTTPPIITPLVEATRPLLKQAKGGLRRLEQRLEQGVVGKVVSSAETLVKEVVTPGKVPATAVELTLKSDAGKAGTELATNARQAHQSLQAAAESTTHLQESSKLIQSARQAQQQQAPVRKVVSGKGYRPLPSTKPLISQAQATKLVDDFITGFANGSKVDKGHAYSRHVGKSEAWLRERLRQSRRVYSVSTFPNQQTADRIILGQLKANREAIVQWLMHARPGGLLPLEYAGTEVIGIKIRHNKPNPINCTRANVVLTAKADGTFRVLTAFPR